MKQKIIKEMKDYELIERLAFLENNSLKSKKHFKLAVWTSIAIQWFFVGCSFGHLINSFVKSIEPSGLILNIIAGITVALAFIPSCLRYVKNKFDNIDENERYALQKELIKRGFFVNEKGKWYSDHDEATIYVDEVYMA